MSPFRFARRYRSTPAKASPMKAFTPRIEQLEDRSVPATTPIPITTLFTEGNFPAPTSPAAGFGAPSRVVIADINNDGRVDFVGGQSKAGSIDVFTSTGATGKGYTPSAINLQFFSLTDANIGAAITAADLTGDGKADVAAITSDGTVLVYRGGGDGSFTRIANFTVDADAKGAPNATLGGIVAGDFNGDGTNDLIITTAGSPNASEYVVLLNNGTGATFTEVANSAKAGLLVYFPDPSQPISMAMATSTLPRSIRGSVRVASSCITAVAAADSPPRVASSRSRRPRAWRWETSIRTARKISSSVRETASHSF